MDMIVFLSFETIIPIGILVLIAVIFSLFYFWYIRLYKQDIIDGKVDIELIDELIYENLSRVKRRKKIIKTINSFVFYGFLIVMAPIFIFSIFNKLSGNISNFGDKGLLAVSSGSMSKKHPVNDHLIKYDLDNQFNTFDLIVVETVKNEEELELYDVIVFSDGSGKLTIHRIVKIEENQDGVIEYTTRGDSNNKDDDFKSTFQDIKGKYVDQRVPLVGAFVLFFQSLIGIVTIGLLIYCIIIFDKQNNKISLEKEKRLEKFKAIGILRLLESNPIPVKLYYKGFVYLFNETGFVDKENIIKDNDFYDKSFEMVIKVDEDKESLVTYYTIDERE